jgi:hypothetical protein
MPSCDSVVAASHASPKKKGSPNASLNHSSSSQTPSESIRDGGVRSRGNSVDSIVIPDQDRNDSMSSIIFPNKGNSTNNNNSTRSIIIPDNNNSTSSILIPGANNSKSSSIVMIPLGKSERGSTTSATTETVRSRNNSVARIEFSNTNHDFLENSNASASKTIFLD